MRIALLLTALIFVACPASETPDDGQGSPVAKAPEPKSPAAQTPEPASSPEVEKKAAPIAKKKPVVDPLAKWRRDPVKRVKAPTDVRRPRKKGTSLTMAGVRYRVMQKGEGTENPTIDSEVTLHYTGWTTDGRMFDSSLKTGEPATFGLRGLIDGWKDVIQYMVVGDTFRAWIPEKLAYKGKKGRPAGTLVFDIELLAFK